MNLSVRSTVVFAVLLVGACATLNAPSNYTLTKTSGEGLLVLSVSGEGLQKNETPVWSYRRSDESEKGSIITTNLRQPQDWSDPPGRLVYIALGPGRYEFYEAGFARQMAPATTYWTVGANGIATPNNPNYAGFNVAQYTPINAEPFTVSFEIIAGQATYIGNMHFVWNELKHQGRVVVSDRSDRDLSLLLQRLPKLRADQIARHR